MKNTMVALSLAVFVLGLAVTAAADNTVCLNAIPLVPDGSAHDGAFTVDPQFRFFVFAAKPGRSYAIMVDNLSPRDVSQIITISNVLANSCSGAAVPTTQRETTEPASRLELDGNNLQSERETIVLASGASPAAVVFRLGGNGGSFRVRVEETTQFHPGLSTGGGFNTFYSIQNTTNASCSVTMTLFNLAGAQVATTTQSVAAGALLATNTQALGVGAGLAGTGRLTHDCPPGGILVDAAIANFNTSPAAIIPAKFQPVR